MSYTLWNEECLEAMKRIPDGSVDMVMCDLPYGTTACKWDTIIPFEPLWTSYRRVCKKNAAIVLTASQPFTSALVMSNVKEFKYDWCWDKANGLRGHLNAKKQPMRRKEDVLVFYSSQPVYNAQMRQGSYVSRKTKPGQSDGFGKVTGVDSGRQVSELYPVNVLEIPSHDPNNSFHPTQKPVALMEYLIKTYTHPGDLVLDNCMGSGTTGVACMNLGRRFIGIEKDTEHGYFQIAERRIREAAAKQEEDWV